MSCVDRDMIEGYSSIGETLNQFLYNGPVKKGVKREHTKEELEAMLEDIRKECWDNYGTGARSKGW